MSNTTLTVQHGAQLIQIAMHTSELWRELIKRVHEVLDDQEILLVVDGEHRWGRGGLRLEHRGPGRHLGRVELTVLLCSVYKMDSS